MSDTINLDLIGTTLRAIQAEQRTIRAENEILRTTIMNAPGEVVRVLNDRIGNFEALTEARIDRLSTTTDAGLEALRNELRKSTTAILAAIEAGRGAR